MERLDLKCDGYRAHLEKGRGDRFFRGHVEGHPGHTVTASTPEEARDLFEAAVREIKGAEARGER